MTGLDKIIARILNDAKDEARKILESANEDCRRMAEEYAAQAEQTKKQIADTAEEECAALVTAAKAKAANTRRNILQGARAEMIQKAFSLAKREVHDTDFGKYKELLVALLTNALIDTVNTAKEAKSLGDEVTECERYEVLFNEKDKESLGETVVLEVRRAALRRVGAEHVEKLEVSEDTADIDSGLILRYGDVSCNCSLTLLLQELQREMEQQIARVLFVDEQNA